LVVDISLNLYFIGSFRMECLIGIKGRDFVLMATDCVAGRSIVALKRGVLILYSFLLVINVTFFFFLPSYDSTSIY